jgi:hypothetical protein
VQRLRHQLSGEFIADRLVFDQEKVLAYAEERALRKANKMTGNDMPEWAATPEDVDVKQQDAARAVRARMSTTSRPHVRGQGATLAGAAAAIRAILGGNR